MFVEITTLWFTSTSLQLISKWKGKTLKLIQFRKRSIYSLPKNIQLFLPIILFFCRFFYMICSIRFLSDYLCWLWFFFPTRGSNFFYIAVLHILSCNISIIKITRVTFSYKFICVYGIQHSWLIQWYDNVYRFVSRASTKMYSSFILQRLIIALNCSVCKIGSWLKIINFYNKLKKNQLSGQVLHIFLILHEKLLLAPMNFMEN